MSAAMMRTGGGGGEPLSPTAISSMAHWSMASSIAAAVWRRREGLIKGLLQVVEPKHSTELWWRCCFVAVMCRCVVVQLFRMLLMLLRDVRHPPHAMTREALCNWARNL